MNSRDKLLLQALKLKELNTQGFTGDGDLVGQVIEQDEAKAKMKNLCAYISPVLFDEVNQVGELLNLSKRQIVEMAVIDFLAKAHDVIEEVGAMPVQQAKAG
jgi:hypothetical protein